MDIEIPVVKDKMIMCRFDPAVFREIEKLAKKHNISHGRIVRALVDAALKDAKK